MQALHSVQSRDPEKCLQCMVLDGRSPSSKRGGEGVCLFLFQLPALPILKTLFTSGGQARKEGRREDRGSVPKPKPMNAQWNGQPMEWNNESME